MFPTNLKHFAMLNSCFGQCFDYQGNNTWQPFITAQDVAVVSLISITLCVHMTYLIMHLSLKYALVNCQPSPPSYLFIVNNKIIYNGEESIELPYTASKTIV